MIEQVDTMKYLGVMISSDGSMDKEVEVRIGIATRMIGGSGIVNNGKGWQQSRLVVRY